VPRGNQKDWLYAFNEKTEGLLYSRSSMEKRLCKELRVTDLLTGQQEERRGGFCTGTKRQACSGTDGMGTFIGARDEARWKRGIFSANWGSCCRLGRQKAETGDVLFVTATSGLIEDESSGKGRNRGKYAVGVTKAGGIRAIKKNGGGG